MPEQLSQDGPTRRWPFAPHWARELTEAARRHVPTQIMLDYAYGGLDDELLDVLYGSHIRSCASCAAGREVYRRQRPADPAQLSEVPEFSHYEPEEQTYPLPKEAGERLRRFIAADSGSLLIVAGEANPAVYNRDLAEVLRQRSRDARRVGASVPKIICGPAMGLDEEIKTAADTIFPLLAEERAIELFVALHRQAFHFRVSGEEFVYTEQYHAAGNPGDRQGYWYRSRPIADLFRRRFESILQAGLARPARREDFVYLQMATIGCIERQHPRFDEMIAEELVPYAEVA
jgi:hypothetical protein